ncbi:Triosephosphate isomerase [Mycoplasmopsis californica]|uniref:Triosephosphate isomerase n=1 Tax=Mycoplasmopsis equigenitalium TaxID=114883 RepID=A0ABY5J4K0_9BACT|nr:triose-phosphate isomerase [Mycoplasmopsis equigenitalium]UUD36880.1 triose-phosphate isomerase [Mycoplasmopsis equigenitalium]VEU69825.1 Triosephosphate isomerase [Mycoplasmopsis californica]
MIIIGNWKMNKTYSETVEFIKEFKELHREEKNKYPRKMKFAIAAPFVNLSAFLKSKLPVCAQNVSEHASGAYTGEVSASMLKDLNVTYAIVGHSERRQYYGETDEIVNAKAKALIEAGITPVICVGETLEEYEAGKTKQVVLKQLQDSLKGLDLEKIVLAYEPIWAIGTGKVATPEIAEEVCKFIRKNTSKKLVIQYGGSVKPDNVAELAAQKNIDGFLVGGASLTAKGFVKLLTLNN